MSETLGIARQRHQAHRMAADPGVRLRPGVGHPSHLGVGGLGALLAAGHVIQVPAGIPGGQEHRSLAAPSLDIVQQVGAQEEERIVLVRHEGHRCPVGAAECRRQRRCWTDERWRGDPHDGREQDCQQQREAEAAPRSSRRMLTLAGPSYRTRPASSGRINLVVAAGTVVAPAAVGMASPTGRVSSKRIVPHETAPTIRNFR